MSDKHYPSVEVFRQYLKYDGGKLFWKKREISDFKNEHFQKIWNARYANKEAGCITSLGGLDRCVFRFRGKMFLRSRIVWYMHNGFLPEFIDHINRNSKDDRIENLRPCTQSQNMANTGMLSRNRSGNRGVNWRKDAKKWRAEISVGKKHIHLGYFPSKQEAIDARVAASALYFKEFSNG